MTDKIPFDVEKWRSGKYDVVTRDGVTVVSLLQHPVDREFPLAFATDIGVDHARLDGTVGCNKGKEFRDDLFLIPKKRKVWIAVKHDDEFPLETSLAYLSKEALLDQREYMKSWHIIEVELPTE